MVSEAAVDAALHEERQRQHLRVLRGSMLGSSGMAAVLATALWPVATRAALLAWLGAVLLAIALRLLVGVAQRKSPADSGDSGRWLQRHRGAYAMHGLVWAAAALMPGSTLGGRELDLIVFALAAVTAGSLSHASFDLRAALSFAVPALLGAALAALRAPDVLAMALATATLIFTAITVSAARRQQAAVRETVRLRLAEASRASEAQHSSQRAASAVQRLADQHELLAQLLQTTQQGYWFVDNEGRTTDVNPAMALLLGRPREALLGRSATELIGIEDTPYSGQALQQLEQGLADRYEACLARPDGTQVHGACTATVLRDASGARVGSVGVWTDITVRRRNEAELRSYELAVNSITDVVSVVDRDERYLLVNDAWCKAARVPRAQALGRRIDEVLLQRVSEERLRALRDCLASGQTRHARGPDPGAQREGCVVETTYFPHLDAQGLVQQVVMVSRDVTEQEHSRAALVASEAEQRALLDNFPGYISRLDARDTYTYVNARLARLMGRAAEAITGHSTTEVLGETRALALQPLLARARAGELVIYEHRVPGVDGDAAIDLQVHMVASADPQIGEPVIYGFTLDVTQRRAAEEALVAARDEAERANRAKSQFLSQMSHELRTPLNAILGFGQLLDSDPGARLPEHQHAWLREMLHGAEHLLSLINEMLDLGRIEAGELQLQAQPVALGGLVDECLSLVQALAQGRGMSLHASPAGLQTVRVQADRRRLKQVLLNLLANALKYNRPGGEVAVRWRDEGAWVWLAVQDNGRGLSEDEQQRLFMPFERLHAAQSGEEGTGIGLALSRRLVQAMGGSIGVESQLGTGSLFWLRLPQLGDAEAAVPLSEQSPDSLDTASPDAAPRTVLYIEDNAVNVVLMEAMLARLPGVRLVSASTPTEGLRLAASDPPALVLLDIQLPEMDGFAVLARLRNMPATRTVPVVAVSANALPADIEHAREAGFTTYLTKPLTLELLLSTVQELLAP